jgi:nucleoside-diphosphate-sugar epimerase
LTAEKQFMEDKVKSPTDLGGRIIGPEDTVLVTGAAGFIGARVVECLLRYGYHNVRCLVRSSGSAERLEAIRQAHGPNARLEVVNGNLLSRDDCLRASQGAAVIYHLAAGRGEKSFPDAFLNTVVTTRNLLEASHSHGCLKRFVSISSFSVYSNKDKPQGRLLDETCPIDARPALRGNAYLFAKIKQDEIVAEYGARLGIPYVIVRPGVVYGPGNEKITGRVGIGTFGVFLHLGGSNPIPFTYVDNCAEAVVLSGIKAGVDGNVFNVVDDNVPSSREYLKLHKRNVNRFFSIYVPHAVSYVLCYLWEKYSVWSQGQLPPIYGRGAWHAFWKKTRYSNQKLKHQLGWEPRVPTTEAFDRFFESCRKRAQHA